MAEFTMRVIDDGARVIVKKQQVEVIHGVSWRISTSKTVRNSQRQIKLAMIDLDAQRRDYYDLSLDELTDLFPTQFERHVRGLDKKSKVHRSYRLETLLPRYIEFMRNEGSKVEQVILDETNTLSRHIRLMNWSGRDVRTITATMLDKLFLSFFKEKPTRSEGTWRKDIYRWQYFFDWIVKIGYLRENTLRQFEWTTPEPLKKKNASEIKPTRVYTDKMLDELYWYLDERPMDYRRKRAIQLMMDTGLRIGECLALSLQDIKMIAYYGDPINKKSNAFHRLEDAFKKGLIDSIRNIPSDNVYTSESDKLLLKNKAKLIESFDDANYYHEFVVENIHGLVYEQGDLLFFPDITDDIKSHLLIKKTIVKLPYVGNTEHVVQEHAKTDKGNRTVSLGRRARRTLTLLYREIKEDAAFSRVNRLWGELGRQYLFLQANGKFLVPNNVSENLKYITTALSKIDSNFYPITSHDLRHAYSTIRVNAAKDYGEVNRISKELGHKNPIITLDTYTHNESANLLYESPDLSFETT